MTFQELLESYGACAPGLAYGSMFDTAQEAWDSCTDIRHMYWSLDVTSTDKITITKALVATLKTMLGTEVSEFADMLEEFSTELNNDPVDYRVLYRWEYRVDETFIGLEHEVLVDLLEFSEDEQDAWCVIVEALVLFSLDRADQKPLCNQLRKLIPDITVWLATNTLEDRGPNVEYNPTPA